MRDNNNFNGPNTGLDQRVGINERPIDLLSYNAGLYRAMNRKAGSDAQEENNPQPGPDDKNWFYVEDVSGLGNTLILRLDFENDSAKIPASYDFYVSKDKESWTKLDTLNSTSKTVMYEFGECEKVYIRCSSANFFSDDDDVWYCVYISCINSYNIGGNSMSLLYGSDFTGNEKVFPECSNFESTFGYLFSDSDTLISAKNLILPATTLAPYCYDGMFSDCTSLTEAPELPATTLATSCYAYMFNGCTLLTEAPQLPATTLATSCYKSMFQSCTALTEVITYANDISAKGCLDHWLDNVAQSGTFYKLGTASYKTGINGIPEGWTVETELPQE